MPILTRFDPWDGVTLESTFAFTGSALPDDVSRSRLDARVNLLHTFEGPPRSPPPASNAFARFRDLGLAMMTQPKVTRRWT